MYLQRWILLANPLNQLVPSAPLLLPPVHALTKSELCAFKTGNWSGLPNVLICFVLFLNLDTLCGS